MRKQNVARKSKVKVFYSCRKRCLKWSLFKKLKRIVKKRFKVYFIVVYSWAHYFNTEFKQNLYSMQLLSEMVDCRMYMTNATLTGYYVEQGLVETLRVTLFWGAGVVRLKGNTDNNNNIAIKNVCIIAKFQHWFGTKIEIKYKRINKH